MKSLRKFILVLGGVILLAGGCSLSDDSDDDGQGPDQSCAPGTRQYCGATNCADLGQGYWYDESCNEQPEPNCDSDHRELCTAADCQDLGQGYWYLGLCQATPQAMIDYSASGISPEHDTTISYSTVSPRGRAPTFFMGNASEYLFGYRGNAALLQFPLPHLTDERLKEVESATLTLRSVQSNMLDGVSIRVSRLTEQFDENVVIWNTRPNLDPNHYVSWTCQPGESCTKGKGKVSIDISSLLINNGHNRNLGLVIERTSQGSNIHFAGTKEHPTVAGPTLDIVYKTVQDPSPPVLPDPPQGQTEEIFGPGKVLDATLSKNNPDKNYGQSTSLTLAPGSYGAEVADTVCSIIDFDLTSATITAPSRADLVLTPRNNMAKGKTIRIYRLTESFTEDTVTWNNRPAYDEQNYVEWTSPGLIKSARMSINIPITQLLKANNQDDHLGLVIKSVDFSDNFTAKDGQWPTYGERPMLRLSTRPVLRAEPILHPNHGLYEIGEDAAIAFTVEGLTSSSLLSIKVLDLDNQLISTANLTVNPDVNHQWSTNWDAPDDHQGFYRVVASLANGTTIEKEGSRPAI